MIQLNLDQYIHTAEIEYKSKEMKYISWEIPYTVKNGKEKRYSPLADDLPAVLALAAYTKAIGFIGVFLFLLLLRNATRDECLGMICFTVW